MKCLPNTDQSNYLFSFILVRRNKNEGDTKGSTRRIKDVPDIVKQNKNESKTTFFGRLQRMTNAAIAEVKVEQEYGIELVNIDKQGNVQYAAAQKEVSERKQEYVNIYTYFLWFYIGIAFFVSFYISLILSN